MSSSDDRETPVAEPATDGETTAPTQIEGKPASRRTGGLGGPHDVGELSDEHLLAGHLVPHQVLATERAAPARCCRPGRMRCQLGQ